MPDILFIALMHLIQQPDKYQFQKVRVVGYATMGFERKALYVSKEDQNHALTKNAVWLDVPLDEKTKALHGQYVLVEGSFDQEKKGHLGLYSGTLVNVDRIELWSKDSTAN